VTISKDLFLAILSMDAYNQGYGRGFEHGKNYGDSLLKKITVTVYLTP